jgi:hypothetical protein
MPTRRRMRKERKEEGIRKEEEEGKILVRWNGILG